MPDNTFKMSIIDITIKPYCLQLLYLYTRSEYKKVLFTPNLTPLTFRICRSNMLTEMYCNDSAKV